MHTYLCINKLLYNILFTIILLGIRYSIYYLLLYYYYILCICNKCVVDSMDYQDAFNFY